MGISSLATKYQFENFGTKWSGTRNASSITTVVVHHQAGTNFDNMPGIWRNAQASAHYGIGQDGTIRAYIDEMKTAWHANNANSYAIGIECTNTTGDPGWQVSEKTIDALVKLIQDIEKRYGRKMTIIGHKDAPGAATACPGPFLYPRLGEIRNRVDGDGGSTATPTPQPKPAKPSKIAEDGKFGPLTANRAMTYEGMTPDGEVSHQYRQACNQNLYAARFDKTLIGSNLIRTWQTRLKAKGFYSGSIDGLCGAETIKAMQRALRTTVDGIISPTSQMVRALQVALNNNKLPW
ncbi:N-acetylmuramoyl-L-alanine amidase A [Enterococcus casseliflavus]|uniref:peptidoglycan recognition protein family protein n=1 Tax=Enterococcus casseliflavus TaxID=37734 RepID=UPI000E071097|nr:N-acetylmuramoyl-L-alanine amidase [Enterococcus casseliflavus]GEB30172.1 hypothetical protein ECA02_32670 [Enterococcus casseliflavus]STP33083.1 N-acetylmuramoyl-L-alanine amidase A [Enterococcus casseliflavus]